MITGIRIDIPLGKVDGEAFLLDGTQIVHQGTADTDLRPGTYELYANKAIKRWIIQGVRGGIRFNVHLDGVDPWSLAYAPRLRLDVQAHGGAPTDPNEILLDGVGADAYKNDPSYIDRVTAGHYDVATGKFFVDHEDGTTIELNYGAILKSIQQGAGGVTVYVYYRSRQDNKIYPRLIDKNSLPNIVSMVLETEQARPGAEALGKIGNILLELVQVRAAVQPLAGVVIGKEGAARAWKAVPDRGSRAAIRQNLGINMHNKFPMARANGAGGDIVDVRVLEYGDEVYFEAVMLQAVGPDGPLMKRTYREMLLIAAERANENGQTTFRWIGKQVNQNSIRHANDLVKSVGVQGSQRMLGRDMEITLRVDAVLITNTPL